MLPHGRRFCLCGLGLPPGVGGGLPAGEIIGGSLRVGGGGEDGPFVVFQDFQPRRDIAGVLLARLRRQRKVSADKGRAQLGDLSEQSSCLRRILRRHLPENPRTPIGEGRVRQI